MLNKLVEQSLQFEYHGGTPPDDARPGISTGWRILPYLLFVSCKKHEYLLHLKDQSPIPVKKGEAMLIPAGLLNKVDTHPTKRSWAMWCHLNYTIMGSVDAISQLNVPNVIGGTSAARMADICLQLVTLREKTEPNSLWSAARLKELGFQFLKQVIEVSDIKEHHSEFLLRTLSLQPVLSHIQNHLGASLTIDDLARIAGRSRSVFHQYFRETMGKAPMEFVRDLRFRSAQLLLSGSDFQVAEVGQRVGYPDPFHFSRAFKALYGMSPKRFRVEQRQGLWAK